MHSTASCHVHHFESSELISWFLIDVNGYEQLNMMSMMLMNMMLMMLMILEEANVTPKPVGRQGIDKGVEEREDYVWKLSM